MTILWTIIIGFVVGLIARAVIPGRDPAGFIITTILGIAGALIGSVMGRVLGFYGEGEARERIEAGIPMGRFAMPSDIGDIAVWLGSDLAAYVTGAEIAAHGGGERPPFLGTE